MARVRRLQDAVEQAITAKRSRGLKVTAQEIADYLGIKLCTVYKCVHRINKRAPHLLGRLDGSGGYHPSFEKLAAAKAIQDEEEASYRRALIRAINRERYAEATAAVETSLAPAEILPEPVVAAPQHIPVRVVAPQPTRLIPIEPLQPLPIIVAKERKCLRCSRMFKSHSAGNRLCQRCKPVADTIA